jgi:cellulose biosynthesis protein BcsQ
MRLKPLNMYGQILQCRRTYPSALPDRRSGLAQSLNNPFIDDQYDYVLIDTQGAIGPRVHLCI